MNKDDTTSPDRLAGREFSLRSPIEFVIVGPRGSREAVLVRSQHAQLDLVGFALADAERPRLSGILFLPDPFPVLRAVDMQIVASWSTPAGRVEPRLGTAQSITTADPEIDKRSAQYRLCWIGLCSSAERGAIKELFERFVPDIQRAMRQKDPSQVELSVAPVIYECARADARVRRARRIMIIVYLLYAAVGVIAAAVFFYFRAR